MSRASVGWSLACAVFLHLGRGSAVSRQYLEASLRAGSSQIELFGGSFLMYQVETVGTIRVDGPSARSRRSAQLPTINSAV